MKTKHIVVGTVAVAVLATGVLISLPTEPTLIPDPTPQIIATSTVQATTTHFGGTGKISLTGSPFNTLTRSSSTYDGTYSFSCTEKVEHTNCVSSKAYISRNENSKNFTITAFSTSSPTTAFQNLVCADTLTTTCQNGQGKSVVINQCKDVIIPNC